MYRNQKISVMVVNLVRCTKRYLRVYIAGYYFHVRFLNHGVVFSSVDGSLNISSDDTLSDFTYSFSFRRSDSSWEVIVSNCFSDYILTLFFRF